jgi:Cu+-exporting ATPase
MGADEFGALARALASSSTHPLSRSVAAHFAQSAPISVREWSEERGEGVQGIYQGATVRLGSPAWLIANGVSFPDTALPRLGSLLALSLGRKLLGLISFHTGPKPGAAKVVRQLIDQGLLVYLVTGDGEAAAQRLGSEVGIPEGNIFSGIRPEQKGDIVTRLQAEGKKVAFVGDGINDAPALTQADLGIAALGASDVARESADVILMKRDLEAIPEILALSAATLNTIRQNLFWAFFYNAAAIPLAMAGLISPVFSALAMGLSDVFVMGNAWRLSRWNPKD